MKINLTNNDGYKWYERDNIYVKGYVFNKNKKLFKNEELIEYFADTKCSFKEKLVGANGIFSVIIKKKNKIEVAVDRLRTIPLFYKKNGENFIISDTNKYDINCDLNEFSVKEFSCSCIVTGNKTLINKVYQVQASEYIEFGVNYKKANYYHDNLLPNSLINKELREGQFTIVLRNITKRLIEKANGRMLIIPLSGGLDSRLIATLLKLYNYENILCFTYGSKDNKEVKISEKVAKKLGFNWVFIEYNKELIKEFSTSKTFKKFFFDKGSNLTSLPHIQDFLAVKELHKKYNLPKDAIFVPGHTLDVIAGSVFDKRWSNNSNKSLTIESILNLQFKYNNEELLKYKSIFIDALELSINKNKNPQYAIFENWVKSERQAKFIVNSVRVYEMFGYEYLLPYWDNEIVMFFKNLPLEDKMTKIFLKKYVFSTIFEKFQVNFKVKKMNIFIRLMRKILPKSMFDLIKPKSQKDLYGFKLISKELGYVNENHINSNLIKYYLKNMIK